MTDRVRVRIHGELLWGTVLKRDTFTGLDEVRIDNAPLSDLLSYGDIITATVSEFVDANGFATYEVEGH